MLFCPGFYSEPEMMDDHTFNEDVFTAEIGPAIPASSFLSASFQIDNSTNLPGIAAPQELSPLDLQKSYYAPKAFYHMNYLKKNLKDFASE